MWLVKLTWGLQQCTTPKKVWNCPSSAPSNCYDALFFSLVVHSCYCLMALVASLVSAHYMFAVALHATHQAKNSTFAQIRWLCMEASGTEWMEVSLAPWWLAFVHKDSPCQSEEKLVHGLIHYVGIYCIFFFSPENILILQFHYLIWETSSWSMRCTNCWERFLKDNRSRRQKQEIQRCNGLNKYEEKDSLIYGFRILALLGWDKLVPLIFISMKHSCILVQSNSN